MRPDRRGMALPGAMVFLLIVFVFCAMLTSMTVLYSHQFRIEQTSLTNRVMIDQIGEDFLAGEVSDRVGDYTCLVDDHELWVFNAGGETVLYVKTDSENNIVQWRYSDPEETP